MNNASTDGRSEISKLIAEVSQQSVPLARRNFPDVVNAIERSADEPERFYAGLSNVFGWVGANPRRTDRREATEQLYVAEGASGSDHELPNLSVFNKLIADLTQGSNLDVVVSGARGSGKTAACNYVINLHFDELVKHGYTYFRADLAKLHNVINTPRLRRDPNAWRVSIADYIALHAFMVALEHSGPGISGLITDPALQWFRKDAITRKEKTAFECFIEKNSDMPDITLAHWRGIRSAFHNRAKNKDRDRDLATYIERCLNVSGLDSLQIRNLYETFNLFLGRAEVDGIVGKTSCKVMLIFDGVDNVRNDEHLSPENYLNGQSSKYWYRQYLQDLFGFLTRSADCLSADRYVYVVRPDTFRDLMNLTKAEGHADGVKVTQFRVTDPPLDLLLNQKSEAARSKNVGNRFAEALTEEERRELHQTPDIKTEFFDRFDWFRREFIAQHKYHLHLCGIACPTDQAVLSIAFSSNLRSFSRNLVRSFRYVDLYAKSHELYAGSFTKAERLALLMESKPLVFEASILAGNAFMVSNSNDDAKGRWCPSLFEFVPATPERRWSGLIMLRVLQVIPNLNAEEEMPSLDDLCNKLEVIGYTRRQVETALFCLINAGAVRRQGIVSDGSPSVYCDTYVKSPKGEYILNLPFVAPSVLYLAATGTCLGGIGSDDTEAARAKAGWIHARTTPRRFWIAAARTGVTLLRHIHTSHRDDLRRLAESAVEDEDRAALAERLTLPNMLGLCDAFAGHVWTSLGDLAGEAYAKALLNEWVGELKAGNV